MPRDLFETEEMRAERIARGHGWIRGNTKRFASFGENDLVPFYFYNRPDDILDTESNTWSELCARYDLREGA